MDDVVQLARAVQQRIEFLPEKLRPWGWFQADYFIAGDISHVGALKVAWDYLVDAGYDMSVDRHWARGQRSYRAARHITQAGLLGSLWLRGTPSLRMQVTRHRILDPYYTGYVYVPDDWADLIHEDDSHWVGPEVAYQGAFIEEGGFWVGFDMNHEHQQEVKDVFEVAVEEIESMAWAVLDAVERNG